ncbi:MAG: hypothetical protein O7G87_15445 [bacterium]|nr:hypothetical protein [bacterium]
MSSRKLTNILLIFMCLFQLLILMNQFDLEVIPQVWAQTHTRKLRSRAELIPVALYGRYKGSVTWAPIAVDESDALRVTTTTPKRKK